ncbi:hypothetical protein [Gilliamella apis]|uniref:hypothetical protein n=1 Tax=Gilliamella apis TaxID=1970738 RepID=UPI00080ECE1C|nr:hypothetical protein [Gilliamella apis]OCG06105.1 hypothetical protein A9G19_02025 [Gilliamella apis]
MWLFWLYESLGFVGVILLIFAYCHFSKKGFWSFLWRNLKWVAWGVVGVWLLIAILCRGDLYNAARCYFRGESMHANTKYSIFWSECQIETTNGSYLPIDRTRALPGSKDHDSNDNGIPADNLIN